LNLRPLACELWNAGLDQYQVIALSIHQPLFSVGFLLLMPNPRLLPNDANNWQEGAQNWAQSFSANLRSTSSSECNARSA
jgi:hypothetical protein